MHQPIDAMPDWVFQNTEVLTICRSHKRGFGGCVLLSVGVARIGGMHAASLELQPPSDSAWTGTIRRRIEAISMCERLPLRPKQSGGRAIQPQRRRQARKPRALQLELENAHTARTREEATRQLRAQMVVNGARVLLRTLKMTLKHSHKLGE